MDAGAAVAQIWREQAPRLIGALVRITRDLDLAEDLAHDAMTAALEQWPGSGVPDNPAAWLMAVARRRAIDHFRRAERHGRAETHLVREAQEQEVQMIEPEADPIEDDVLRLMLMTCHPALTTESQVALTLRLLGGLTSREIARAFMVPEATIVRRITRAKSTLADVARRPPADGAENDTAATPFEVPDGATRQERLPAVLHVVYLIFTEGYAATAGDDWLRPTLCNEAIRLGRLVTAHFGDQPEAHGLVALMLLQSSRTAARTDATGAPVMLERQDRARWDQVAIQRGLESLGQAVAFGARGYYTLQAAIAALHARAASVPDTDWTAIAGLYDQLAALTPSPMVALNRAVAHGMADGPLAGLNLVEELADAPALQGSHLLPSVRGDLLLKVGRADEARAEFTRAATLAGNARERDFLLERAARAGSG